MSFTSARRSFLKHTGWATLAMMLNKPESLWGDTSSKPNIILCMADDLGWGDTGYNGHPVIQTPHLDRMSQEGIRFDRFYSAAPVCSPTRGSCITGRHPFRYGVFTANAGHLKKEELSLAEVLRSQGYTTGHFGKWHLGTLTTKIRDSNRGRPGDTRHYSPPWVNGFDVCFSTEAKTPTWDPMITPSHWKQGKPGEPFGTHYWTGPDRYETENLSGDDSRIIMDRVIPFLRKAAQSKTPFFAVVWFHAPHSPVVAGSKYRSLYKSLDENKQHYYGCITALDEQVGRMRSELKNLGLADNTLLWFCSDNGPAGVGGGTRQQAGNRQQGSAGPYRGRKGSLYEGGVRVPGLLVWPQKIHQPRTVSIPCVTSDYYPTLLDIVGCKPAGQPLPLDGISLLPLIQGQMKQRPSPIGFEMKNQLALSDNRYKIISQNKGDSFELYDLLNDPGETHDLAQKNPGLVTRMKTTLKQWRDSCTSSRNGNDYP